MWSDTGKLGSLNLWEDTYIVASGTTSPSLDVPAARFTAEAREYDKNLRDLAVTVLSDTFI